LVGHAVTLEDTDLLPHWKVPEPFASAICVPVSSPTNPLGTLWLFCDRKRDFTTEQTNLVEIVAGRLASDLEREVLLSEGMRSKKVDRHFKFASHWQVSSLPTFAPVVHGWSVAGWNRQADIIGGDFYDWSILPDGMLSIAVGDADGTMMEATLVATTVQTSLKSHANYRHNAKQMVDRVNETLWTSSAGDQFSSLFYGKVDCDNGHVEFCTAGKINAYRISSRGVRRINSDTTYLGTQPESAHRKKQITLKKGESLLIASEGTCALLDGNQRPQIDAALEYIRENPSKTADEYVDAIGQPFESPEGDDRTIVVIKRHA
jgi:serine phosphatase RsbU (regulator of sigma subunit)